MRIEEEIREELKDLFEDNTELFNEAIEELDSYNDYLGDDRYYYMEEIDELFSSYNQDDYTIDDYGEKHYCSFNPNCDYFKVNAYGHLVSAWYKDYSDYLDDYFIDSLLENHSDLSLDADIETLLDELENAE